MVQKQALAVSSSTLGIFPTRTSHIHYFSRQKITREKTEPNFLRLCNKRRHKKRKSMQERRSNMIYYLFAAGHKINVSLAGLLTCPVLMAFSTPRGQWHLEFQNVCRTHSSGNCCRFSRDSLLILFGNQCDSKYK